MSRTRSDHISWTQTSRCSSTGSQKIILYNTLGFHWTQTLLLFRSFLHNSYYIIRRSLGRPVAKQVPVFYTKKSSENKSLQFTTTILQILKVRSKALQSKLNENVVFTRDSSSLFFLPDMTELEANEAAERGAGHCARQPCLRQEAGEEIHIVGVLVQLFKPTNIKIKSTTTLYNRLFRTRQTFLTRHTERSLSLSSEFLNNFSVCKNIKWRGRIFFYILIEACIIWKSNDDFSNRLHA